MSIVVSDRQNYSKIGLFRDKKGKQNREKTGILSAFFGFFRESGNNYHNWGDLHIYPCIVIIMMKIKIDQILNTP